MSRAKSYSEELSAAERDKLNAFVVPAPSDSMEDKLMLRLQKQVHEPSGQKAGRTKRVAVAAVFTMAAAAMVVWALEVERPGGTQHANLQQPAERRAPDSTATLPTASRPSFGWLLRGSAPESYDTGLDPAVLRQGSPVHFIRAREANTGFGTWLRRVDANQYVGKRVRLTAFVRTDAVDAWAGLWMRVDAGEEFIAFDNMESRPIRGTTDWTKYEVVLDVGQQATEISYGILLAGVGTAWTDDFELEIVPDSVSTTQSWYVGGSSQHDYDTGLDSTLKRGGKAARYLRSSKSTSSRFGTWMTSVNAAAFQGKRVRLSAFVRSDALDAWSGLWMRVDAKEGYSAFDNMVSRPIKGTTDWAKYEVVLNVDSAASQIAYGVLLNGNGTVWLDEVVLEVVSDDVPTTK